MITAVIPPSEVMTAFILVPFVLIWSELALFFFRLPYIFFLEFFSAFTWMSVSPCLIPYTFESTSGRARYVTEDCCTPSQLFCSEVHNLSLSLVLLYYSLDRKVFYALF